MQLIRLLVIIACVGGIVYLINRYTPIDAKFKTVVTIVGIVGAILYALHDFQIF
jgi:glucose uptake protein GlcU